MHELNSRLDVKYDEQAAVIILKDEKILEDKDIRDLQDQIHDVLKQNETGNIVMDFSRVQFMSSAVLGLLIKISRKIYESEGNLALCGIRAKIYEIFKITRLTKIFDIYDDVDSALADLAQRQ